MNKSYIIYKRQKVKVTIQLEKSKKLLPNLPTLLSLRKVMTLVKLELFNVETQLAKAGKMLICLTE